MTEIEKQVGGLSEAVLRIATTETAVSAHTARQIIAGAGLTGGGDLSADRTLTLSTTGVTPASLGSGSRSVSLTVDAMGRLTGASDTPIAIPSSQLTDYSTGSWSPVLSLTTPPTTPFTMDVVQASYTKVGRVVTAVAFIRTDAVNTAGASGFLCVNGLPFISSIYAPISIGSATDWINTPTSGYVDSGGSRIYLLSKTSVNGPTSLMSVSDVTTGTSADKNQLMFSVTYFT